jgi:hypothetical protein
MQNEMELVESYDNTINEALSGIAETWMAKNVVGIESRLKTEITEDFIHGLVQLLEDHNIFLPEEKTDVVEEMADRIIELEGQLNEQIEANIQLNAVLAEEMKSQIVEGFAEGLNETEIAKFATLCEGIESNVIDDYEDKVRQIRTSYFTNSGVKPGTGINEERVLTDVEVNAEVKTLNEAAKPVMSSISRFAPRSVKS